MSVCLRCHLDLVRVFHALALVPSRLDENLGLSLITLTLLHGDWRHLAGNLYPLFLFGALVEERLGWKRYLSCAEGASPPSRFTRRNSPMVMP